MLEREAEDKAVTKLVAEIIKRSLTDLYGKSKKLRVEARNFFEKSKLFELTKLNYQALKEEYKRIHNISDEYEKELEEEDRLYVVKQEYIKANAERSEKPKDVVKTSKRTRGKLRFRPKQRKRNSE